MPCPNLGGTADLATVFKLNPTGRETVGVQVCGFSASGSDARGPGNFRALPPVAASRVAPSGLPAAHIRGERAGTVFVLVP